MITNNYEEMFIMITNNYEEMLPVFRTTVLVNKKPSKPYECPFYGEQAVSYKQPINSKNDKVHHLKTRINNAVFSHRKNALFRNASTWKPHKTRKATK